MNPDATDRVITPTERWGADLYGDPCAECGYDWSVTPTVAVGLVAELPSRFGTLLMGCSGHERHPDLSWGAIGYVCHVSDNLRAWAEGLGAALASSDEVPVPGYDPDLLARARRYDRITAGAALWSLTQSVRVWCDVVPRAVAVGAVLRHAARGEQRARDVARNNAHDGCHHLWDVARILHGDDSPAAAVSPGADPARSVTG